MKRRTTIALVGLSVLIGLLSLFTMWAANHATRTLMSDAEIARYERHAARVDSANGTSRPSLSAAIARHAVASNDHLDSFIGVVWQTASLFGLLSLMQLMVLAPMLRRRSQAPPEAITGLKPHPSADRRAPG